MSQIVFFCISVNAIWGGWGSWSICDSRTGERKRSRECNNPSPGNNGLGCSGTDQDGERCAGILIFKYYEYHNIILLVNGGWGGWAPWSSCDSRTGKKERTRVCNFPSPKNSGYGCSGNNEDFKFCAGRVYDFYILLLFENTMSARQCSDNKTICWEECEAN